MKKILFALALCSPSAFSGGMVNTVGDMMMEATLLEVLEQIPVGTINSFADLTRKVQDLLKGIPGAGPIVARTFLNVVLRVITSVMESARADDPEAFQELFCGKGSLKDGQYSIRSFNGLLCIVPYLYETALKICKGVPGFENSGCVRKGSIVMEKMGNAYGQSVNDGARQFPEMEDRVAAFLNPPKEPAALAPEEAAAPLAISEN